MIPIAEQQTDPTWSATIRVGNQYVTLNVYQQILAAEEDQLKDLIANIKQVLIKAEEKQTAAVPGGGTEEKKKEDKEDKGDKDSSEEEETAKVASSKAPSKKRTGRKRFFSTFESFMQKRYHRNDIEANYLREKLGIEDTNPVYSSPEQKAEAEKRAQAIEKFMVEKPKVQKKKAEPQHGPEPYQSFNTFINHGPLLLWSMELFKKDQIQDLISRALRHNPVLGLYVPNVEQTTGAATIFFKKDDLAEFRKIMRAFTEEKLKTEKAEHRKAEGLSEEEDLTGTYTLQNRIEKIQNDKEALERAKVIAEQRQQEAKEEEVAEKKIEEEQNRKITEKEQQSLNEANSEEIGEEARDYYFLDDNLDGLQTMGEGTDSSAEDDDDMPDDIV